MSIDWITVAAQIVNFLVLVWLLKRFLYRPILDGIDARENGIAARMGEAAKIREAAEAVRAEYEAKVAALGASEAQTIEEARGRAEAERDAILAEARKRVAREQAERESQRAEEARRYTADLHRRGASALLALTRKALADLAGETLEQRIVAHAADRFDDMAEHLRKAAGSSRTAVVTTRDPLPPDVRQTLDSDLSARLPGVAVEFRTDPATAPGLTLRLGGAQVAWTVDSYLDGLEDLLDQGSGPAARKGRADVA
ncbi:ATP synthase subunit B [Celeribacter indicus]|uniref:ATP synthase subunit b n=1 Tax=Celeribacter indicus TaxID=1208324 RepID=A0A0B5E5Y8_9RHOB|nr:ATP synthase subunit B [Celeribacter indicus]AJE48441.1 ATP synthase F0 subunit B [Celeribacter indicus]SDX29268.1 ATP synthase F0 subcomplex B subunit [Celeribacter indicus]